MWRKLARCSYSCQNSVAPGLKHFKISCLVNFLSGEKMLDRQRVTADCLVSKSINFYQWSFCCLFLAVSRRSIGKSGDFRAGIARCRA